MTSDSLRERFLKYFESKGHVAVPSSALLPDDPSVLLTTAGMQQFKPYYTGALDPLRDKHPFLDKPLGSKNTASVQKSFRTSDIDEVGDDTHLTFFEMLGNFSFGGYFKQESIEYAYDFITNELGLTIDFVSVFGGDEEVPADNESAQIWQALGVENIRQYGREDNFWGPTGDEGPCGPTTEIYVKNANGESVEIWNIVFNEYYQQQNKTLEKLEMPGVDTGMGLERLAMVAQGVGTIFQTDLFDPIVSVLPQELDERDKRVVADHARAISFLVSDGVRPSNKEAGYVLRRLMRRIMVYENIDFDRVFRTTVRQYNNLYPELNDDLIAREFRGESEKFNKTLHEGLRQLAKMEKVGAKEAFYLYETYGLPFEVLSDKIPDLSRREFDEHLRKHQERSRSTSAGVFKGGLVDNQPQTIKHHTAHHLLLAALRQILGEHVVQRGSNVSSERLRIDFSHPEKLTKVQREEIETLVNQKIEDDLRVERSEMLKSEAEKLGALAEFGAKYGDMVTVYTIYNKDGSVFSRELCGGPHVEHTSVIGKFKILKEEASSAGVRRIKAQTG